VKVITREGKVFERVVRVPLGSLERPMSFEDCAAKFRDCAKGLDTASADQLIELVGKLEQVEDIGKIIQLMT
jgi:2-methylcitrate dehydratase PrpD